MPEIYLKREKEPKEKKNSLKILVSPKIFVAENYLRPFSNVVSPSHIMEAVDVLLKPAPTFYMHIKIVLAFFNLFASFCLFFYLFSGFPKRKKERSSRILGFKDMYEEKHSKPKKVEAIQILYCLCSLKKKKVFYYNLLRNEEIT